MTQIRNDHLIKILKRIIAYSFLYLTFLGIFYDFAYDAWLCAKPIGLMLVLLKAFVYFLLFALINHTLIRKIVGLKTVVIFETILILVILGLSICYATIENRFHGVYSTQIVYCEESPLISYSAGMPEITCYRGTLVWRSTTDMMKNSS